VVVLLYFGNSHPDISFAAHQFASYTHSSKQSHKDALVRTKSYLKGTLDKGLILNPSSSFKINCYPYANFQACGQGMINKTHIVFAAGQDML
jgi:hypothetical protein